MTTIEELKQQLQAMLDTVEDKQGIERIGIMGNLLDKVEAENQQLINEQKDFMRDYKELVKHTSFKPTGTETQEIPESTTIDFGDFIKAYNPNNIKEVNDNGTI